MDVGDTCEYYDERIHSDAISEYPAGNTDGPFPALRCLVIEGWDSLIRQIFETSFPFGHHLNTLAMVVSEREHTNFDGICLSESSKIISKRFPLLQHLHINTHLHNSPRMTDTSLRLFSTCVGLRELNLNDISLGDSDLIALSKVCKDLEQLKLADGRMGRSICNDGEDDSARSQTFESVSLECMETIALNLPKLTRLCITIVASDLSNLVISRHSFKKLTSFELFCSFVNFDVEGFCEEKAVKHLSILLPPGCTVAFDTEIRWAFSLEPLIPPSEYRSDYEDLSERLTKMILQFMNVRADERARLAYLGILRGENPL